MGVISDTDDLIYEVMDQVQRLDRMVRWLVTRAGGDAEVIRRLPGETAPRAVTAVNLPAGAGPRGGVLP